MATVLDLLRVRGCEVQEKEYTNEAHWVSYTSRRGHRWVILGDTDTKRALEFLTMLNTEEL